ncbi:hypothetical protein Tco_1404563 [Tanacetum coccineum]
MVGLSCLAAPAAELSSISRLGVGEAQKLNNTKRHPLPKSGVSGDGGGVVKARSLSTSSLGGSDMDGSSLDSNPGGLTV